MTDQLEPDLRAMLAARAAEITADVPGGEAAISARLAAGDAAVAEVVPLARPGRPRWPLAAAAAVAAVALLGAVIWAANDDDDDIITNPAPEAPAAIFIGEGSPESVAGTYVFDRLDLSPGQQLTLTRVPAGPDAAADLAGIAWSFEGGPSLPPPTGGTVVLRDLGNRRWEVVESFSDGASIDEVSRTSTAITVHSTGPSGSYLELSVHDLDGTSITAGGCGGAAVSPSGTAVDEGPGSCDLVDEPLPSADQPLTVRLSVVTAEGVPLTLEERLVPPVDEDADAAVPTDTSTPDGPSAPEDPTVGEPGDAAKDVAERVALAVFGQDYVTMSATDVGAITEVTMEGAGGAVVAEVAFDAELGRERLIRIRPADGAEQIGVVAADGALTIEVPEDGNLSYRLLDAALAEVAAGATADATPGSTVPVGAAEDDVAWMWVSLETPDGRVLQWFDVP